MLSNNTTLSDFNNISEGHLPGHLGITVTQVDNGKFSAYFDVKKHHLAPNGYLHAGSVVSLADTCAGYGCVANLPEGAIGFTTIELKSNFLGTALKGVVECTATLIHGGKKTQVWDATVIDNESGKTMALFRCTQMILYPK